MKMCWRMLLLLGALCPRNCRGELYIPNLPRLHYAKLGTFTIGAMLPVHQYDRANFCGESVSTLGVLQRMEAIAYAVEEINERSDLLGTASLGFAIFDDCNKDVTALAQALRFRKVGTAIKCEYSTMETPHYISYKDPCENNTVGQRDVIGVIASESSDLSVQVANMLTAFKIPLISYMSTSASLSDKRKYPYFQRPIPSDLTQVEMILQLLKKFNWQFVSVLYSEGAYGTEAFNRLRYQAEADGICFAETYEISSAMKGYEMNEVVQNLINIGDKASVVIVIAYWEQVRKILETYKWLNNLSKVRLTWIASDSWGWNLEELAGIEEQAAGMLSVNIDVSNVPRFDEYFNAMTPNKKTKNPWLHQFWEMAHECQIGSANHSCNSSLRFSDSQLYKKDMYISAVFDSVYTYAFALNKTIQEQCHDIEDYEYSHEENEVLQKCVDSHLFAYLRNVSFIGERGEVKYDDYGDGPAAYRILNMQKLGDRQYRLVQVGHWDQQKNQLVIRPDEIVWTNGSVPLSRCSVPCGKGQGLRRREAKCCWDCEPCQRNQIVLGHGLRRQCQFCLPGTWPEPENRTTCLPIRPRHIAWTDPIGITFCVFAILGATLSLLVLALYIANNRNSLIKACSRELSYMMLMGILLSYVLSLTFIGELTNTKCVVHLYSIGLSFTCMYGPLVTKTNRIYRIFTAGQKTKARPPLIDSRYQVIIAFAIVFVHAVMLTVGMSLDEPYVHDFQPAIDVVERVCLFPLVPFILALAYNAALVLVCAFYAFKTRKLPDNYNESRFIAFCVYSTLFLWLTFVPVYFVMPLGYQRSAVLVIAMVSNATVILVCMYLPKLFAIYCVSSSKIQTNELPTQSTSDGCKPKLRFSRRNQVYPISCLPSSQPADT